MSLEDVKLLATDLDGTLLSSNFEVEPFDITMLTEFQKTGRCIALVSGMSLSITRMSCTLKQEECVST